MIHVRGVVHHQHDASDDLDHEADREDDTPDPHPVEVLRRRDHQRVVDEPEDRKPFVDPLLGAGFRLVVLVRDAAHVLLPYPSLMVVSSRNTASGIGRFVGAGPLRIRPAVS